VDDRNAPEFCNDTPDESGPRQMTMDYIDPVILRVTRNLRRHTQHSKVIGRIEAVHLGALFLKPVNHLILPGKKVANVKPEVVPAMKLQRLHQEHLRSSPYQRLY